MMKWAAWIFAVLSAAGCTTAPGGMVVLDYRDFGPQAAAYEAIGMEWWQWERHGDADPTRTDDVRVVVYRDLPLRRVKRAYPVVPAERQDYRCLAYDEAMEYLDRRIKEDAALADRLRNTKGLIEERLGQADD